MSQYSKYVRDGIVFESQQHVLYDKVYSLSHNSQPVLHGTEWSLIKAASVVREYIDLESRQPVLYETEQQ